MNKKSFLFKFIFLFLLISSVFCEEINLKTLTKNKIIFFSINEFVEKNNLKSTYYESKEKLEIIYEGNKIYFSPASSFCRINDRSYHMRYATLLLNNKLYIPAASFQKIIQSAGLSMQIVKLSKGNIVFNMNVYNIHDFYVDKKHNGVEIALHTNKKFKEKDIATSIDSNGWLNITIIDGVVDSAGVYSSYIKTPIKKVNTLQSQQSAQLSFLLQKNPDDIVITTTDNSINILLTISQKKYASIIEKKRNQKKHKIIVLDPGHGGKDPGAIGINKLQEKEVTLDIARHLTKMLERNAKFQVVNTRDEDVFIPLWERTQIANNADGDIFISIHANSTDKSSKIKGFETFLLRIGKTDEAIEVAKRENSVINLESDRQKYKKLTEEELIIATMTQNNDMKESEDLAAIIQNHLGAHLTTSRNRGVKQAGFHVLVGASMPNVLVEVGFLSNKEEAKNLSKYQYRRKIAAAIYEAIMEFDSKNATK